jgi:hypothetical protein
MTCTSEMYVDLQWTIWHFFPEYRILHLQVQLKENEIFKVDSVILYYQFHASNAYILFHKKIKYKLIIT